MRYDRAQTQAVMQQLGSLCDPLALASWIVKKTGRGKRPGPEPWTYTREFFADYGRSEDADKAAQIFELVGVKNEVDASIWLAEHQHLIP